MYFSLILVDYGSTWNLSFLMADYMNVCACILFAGRSIVIFCLAHTIFNMLWNKCLSQFSKGKFLISVNPKVLRSLQQLYSSQQLLRASCIDQSACHLVAVVITAMVNMTGCKTKLRTWGFIIKVNRANNHGVTVLIPVLTRLISTSQLCPVVIA